MIVDFDPEDSVERVERGGMHRATFLRLLFPNYDPDRAIVRPMRRYVSERLFEELPSVQLLKVFQPLVEDNPDIRAFDGTTSLLHEAFRMFRHYPNLFDDRT